MSCTWQKICCSHTALGAACEVQMPSWDAKQRYAVTEQSLFVCEQCRNRALALCVHTWAEVAFGHCCALSA